MKTIVAPTDFSPISLNAVYYAADLACVVGAGIALIHVCQMPLAISEVPAPTYGIPELMDEAEHRIGLLKEKILRRTNRQIEVTTEVKLGNILPEINEYCDSQNVYAVVMGGESAGPFERVLLGGKTISAIDEFLWPLIIVPPESKFSGIKKIGLACDLRDVAETVPVDEIKRLVKQLKAELHVLNVVTEKEATLDPEMIKESRKLREMLKGLDTRYHYLSGDDIENEIVEFADKNKFDFLIVIPKNHTLISKLFRKRYSKKLVLHTHIPLMTIHE